MRQALLQPSGYANHGWRVPRTVLDDTGCASGKAVADRNHVWSSRWWRLDESNPAASLKAPRQITDAQWPSRHLCRLVIDREIDAARDNGATTPPPRAWTGKRAHFLPYRPDWNGLAESSFGLIHQGDIK